MTPKIYDVLIAGSGPAGLAAALGLSRVKRTAAIFTKTNGEGFRNEGITEMHNVLSRDKMHPLDFRKVSREQIEAYGTTDFVETNLVSMRAVKIDHNAKSGIEGFEAKDADGRIWRGRKLILAMGSVEVFPEIKGYRENWPKNIFQCLFCDGHERSHLPGGVLGFDTAMSAHIAQMVNLLRTDDSGPVTVFTNGVAPDAEGMASAFETIEALGCKIEPGKIIELVPTEKPDLGVLVRLEGGRYIKMGYLGHKPATVLAGRGMIEALGVEITEHPVMGATIKIADMMQSTSVRGIFAAGDSSTPLKAVSNALASGATAAAGIVQQLIADDLAASLALHRSRGPSVAAMFD